MQNLPNHLRPASLVLVLILALGLVMTGCSSDDDDNPTEPTTISEFDADLAQAQTAIAAPMAIEMVENMPFFSDGFIGKDFSYTFAWDTATQSWRAETTFSDDGYSFQFVYHVQYRDSQGNPQQSDAGAVTMYYTEDGIGDFTFEDDRSSLYAHQEYENELTIRGLDTTTLLITGSGGYNFIYEVYSDGNEATLDLTVTWETLGNGISFPEDGCPVGAIRYHFAPYYVDVIFDGNDTVDYTLYTSDGVPVPGGSGTETMLCGG